MQTDKFPDPEPGAYVAVVCSPFQADAVGLRLRRAGWTIRDVVAVAGVRDLFGFIAHVDAESTVSDTVVRTGRGILDIDACRVASSGDHKRPWQPSNTERKTYGRHAGFEPTNADGRWPSNTVFRHSRGCQHHGVKKVKAISGGTGTIMTDTNFGQTSNVPQKPFNYAQEDGTETVDDWDCAEDCPVRHLDHQSGMLTSGGGVKRPTESRIYGGTSYQESVTEGDGEVFEADSGGASRFFQQFASREEARAYLKALVGEYGTVVDMTETG